MTIAGPEQRLRARIAMCAPGLDIRSLRVIEEGWDSQVAVVNEDWIFRFPRNGATAAQLRIEQALLPQLAPELPLAIPKFRYACLAHADGEWPFVGYRMIPGVQLSRAVLDAAEPTARQAVARQLGEFVRALHSFPLDRGRRLAPTLGSLDRAIFVAEYTEIKQQVFPLLSSQEREWVSGIYAIAADDAAWHFEPVLVHNDLTAAHILFDPTAQRLIGVLDFGDMAIGDPAIDLTGLLEYGSAFVDEVIQFYGRALDAGFQRRLGFYRPRMWLTDLRYHLDQNNTDRATALLARLREECAAHTM